MSVILTYLQEPRGNAFLRLWAHIDSPELSYAHRWRVGDLLLWDNRSTMHRRDPFDASAHRIMHRTQIKGREQPRAWPAA